MVKEKLLNRTNDIEAIGHRTVHGGEEFASSVLITPEVIDTMKRLSPLSTFTQSCKHFRN